DQITATSPSGSAGTVNVTITTPSGTSAGTAADQFTYEGAPVVTAVSPAVGLTVGGTSVTITGTGFTGASAVEFGTTLVSNYIVSSGTQIVATAPAGSAGAVNVFVTTADGTSATSSPADEFTYEAAPTVASVSPAVGLTSGGTSVTIAGTAFTGASAVDFG